MANKKNVKLGFFVLVLVLVGALAFGFIPPEAGQGRIHKTSNYTVTDDYTATDDIHGKLKHDIVLEVERKDGYTATDDLHARPGNDLVIFPSWFGEDGYTATDDFIPPFPIVDDPGSF